MRRALLVVALLLLPGLAFGQAQPVPADQPIPAGQPLVSPWARLQPVTATSGMVTSQEGRATRIGLDILKRGGNAVDAAVAVGFALAVTLPRAGNLGGGGFMLIHKAQDNRTTAIDYRETAPAAATKEMFLDAKGNADPAKSTASGLGVGVPGTVAGFALAIEKYGSGKFTIGDLAAPAVALARDGIPVEDDLADSLPQSEAVLARYPSTKAIFFGPDDTPLKRGDTLVQTDLADTLLRIARDGPAGFYEGPTAERIVAAVRGAGGAMTLDDLKGYQAIEREPVTGNYRGYGIASMPPPSSGGTHVVEILNILEGYDLAAMGAGSADALHLQAEAMKRAYADRSQYLGDPGFTKVPLKALISKDYAAAIRAGISLDKATPSSAIKPGDLTPFEGDHTTHFSVVDGEGNVVSNTYTLNLNYGLGLVADGTGVLLNNELDDFAAKPGAPNAFGLIGGDANAPAPGKRPLSSMSPTIVFKEGKPFLVTGSPGGSRIISTVVQVISNVVDHGMNVAEAVAAPRMHHQWAPDMLRVERGFSADTLRILQSRGHMMQLGQAMGSANTIMVTGQGLAGTADPRVRGSLAAGY
jgi:gamma-glutamyltranspeptidase/glutathione hydrolase